MSLQTPTTKDIDDDIIAQLQAVLNQTIPLFPKSFLRVLSKTLAGVFILLYKYAGFTFLQIFVRTASDQPTTILGQPVTPLTEWGRLIGVGDPTAATNAELLIDVTVQNQTGILPSNSQLLSTKNGVTYVTIAAVPLNAATVQTTVRAVSDQAQTGGEGIQGNLNPGDDLAFANPLANVARAVAVLSQTITAANQETTAAYRQRIIDRFQKRPQGGAYADYEAWGEEVTGIVNIYPYTSANPGQVDIYVEATVLSSGSPDGIPTAAQLTAVYDNIQFDLNGLPSRRPANALVNTFAITRKPFDVNITGIVVDDLAQTQTDLTAAITEYFLDREPHINGLSILPRRDRITASAVGGVVDDIVTAAGGIFTAADIKQAGNPVTLYTLAIGEKAKALTVTFI